MNKLILLALIFAVASAHTAYWVRWTDVSVPAFMRLQYGGVDRVVLEVLGDGQGYIARDFPGNFINAKAAKIKHIDAMAVLRKDKSPEEFCNFIADALPATFDGTFWIWVQSFYLKLDNVQARLPFIEDVTYYCKQRGIKTGILTSKDDWKELFIAESYGSNSKILAPLPLWYYKFDPKVTGNVKIDGPGNFDDFESFGPWKKPFMKLYLAIDERGVDGLGPNKSFYKGSK